MDNEEFVCPKCDEECHSNGHWQNVTLWYCPTCDMEFEVILERSAFLSTRPASASTDSAEADNESEATE